jgi:holin-like protein
MLTVLSVCGRYLRAFIIIYLCLYSGNGIASLLPITIPGRQILPVNWVKPGCHLIIRYMALLFVPISVGVMSHTDILSAQFGPIVISCVVSTFVVLAVVGVSAHQLHSRRPLREPNDE